MKTRWLLMILFLTPAFYLHAQIYFSEQIIINQADVNKPESVYTADLDGDGDMDVLSASRDDDKIAWYENLDGKGTFGPQQVITQAADGAQSVYAVDLDGDSDMDVLSASITDDKIAWYENTDGKGTFGPQRVISLAANGAIWVHASDLDGDSDMDVLAALYSDNAIVWYENTDGKGTFGPPKTITTEAGLVWSIYGADLDGDGDVDVLSASTIDDKIAWYENTDGKGTFGPQRVISAITNSWAMSVYAADLDGDGDMDVLSATNHDNKIAWYENTDGRGTFGPQQVITTATHAPWSVYAADLDHDGDIDVLSASYADDQIACYENIDSRGTFGPQQVITTKADGARSVYASDLDGDGRMDVLSVSRLDNKIAWYRHREATLWDGFVEHLIDADKGANSIECLDLDGDGDADLIGATNEIAYYENLDFASGTFFKHPLANGTYVINAADMDGDNDVDILAGSGKEIVWWENTNRDTLIKHLIDEASFQSRSIYAMDLDGDGDTDVLGASSLKGNIAWWENDGSEQFAKKNIATNLFTIKSISAIDMDRDGDGDLLSTESSAIAWWENDGAENFTRHTVASNLNFAVYAVGVDIDMDNDMDVVGVDEYGDQIILFANNGLQGFTKVVIDAEINWPTFVYVSDLDNDDDLDIIAVSNIDDYVCVYENLGFKSFYKQIMRKNFSGASSVHAADLDNDGDMDIIAAASDAADVIWLENKLLVNPNPKAADIVVSPDTLFFSVGPENQNDEDELVFSIKNMGNATLHVQNILCEKDWLTDIDTLNFLVKPGAEQQVTLRCSAAGMFNGIYAGTLEIHSNDRLTPVFNVSVVLEMRRGLEVKFVDEIEPNNKPSQAQQLFAPSPSGIKGTISVSDVGEKIIQNDDIEDLYVFTIGSSGIKLKLYDISADLDLILMKIVGNTTTIWGSNHRGSAVDEEFEKTDLEPGTYYVGVSIYDAYPIQNSSTYSLALMGDIVTGVKEHDNSIPLEFSLEQNYPNPVSRGTRSLALSGGNPNTSIGFALSKPGFVTLKIYNTLGQEVATLVSEKLPAGKHQRVWEAEGLANGVYLYRLEAGEFVQTKKLILLW